MEIELRSLIYYTHFLTHSIKILKKKKKKLTLINGQTFFGKFDRLLNCQVRTHSSKLSRLKFFILFFKIICKW